MAGSSSTIRTFVLRLAEASLRVVKSGVWVLGVLIIKNYIWEKFPLSKDAYSEAKCPPKLIAPTLHWKINDLEQ